MSDQKLTVGQTVWVVGCGNRQASEPKETRVLSIARKYFKVEGHYRFLIETLKIDSGQYTSNYRVILSLDAYEQEKELLRVWSKIRSLVSYQSPVNLETAKEILSLLKPNL